MANRIVTPAEARELVRGCSICEAIVQHAEEQHLNVEMAGPHALMATEREVPKVVP